MRLFKKTTQVLLLVFALAACKKEGIKDEDPNTSFDMNNPEGYLVVGTSKLSSGSNILNLPIVIKFLGDNKLEYYVVDASGIQSYKLDDNTIKTVDIEIKIESGKITHAKLWADEHPQLKLVNEPATNQLEGKTFTGKYYNADGSVLHNSFFYSFIAGNKLQAGYNVGTVVRTNDYTNVGNIAAYHKPQTGHVEFVLLMDGKLNSSYLNGSAFQYGILSPQ